MRRLTSNLYRALSYDYKARRSVTQQVPGLDASLPALETYDDPGAYAWANAEEAERYGRLHLEAQEARQQTWLGRSSVRSLRPGWYFSLSGLPAAPRRPPADARYTATEITHAGINNLPAATMAAVVGRLSQAQRVDGGGLETGDIVAPIRAPERLPAELLKLAERHGYGNAFEALAQDRPWRTVEGTRYNAVPTVPGLMSAIVVGPGGRSEATGGDEIWCDALGRIKVRFHWQQGERVDDRDSCWLRVVQRQAGPGMGWQWLPRIGQEVLVDFLAGDIDRPFVRGGLYDGRGEGGIAATPGGQSGESNTEVFDLSTDHQPAGQGNLSGGHSPAWHGGAPGSHRHAAGLSGFKSKEFGGRGYNQLVFDDSDRQQRVQLKSTQHASELNLGHLIHQADNYRGSFRGQGAELRTDAWGALRAARGLTLCTWIEAQPRQPAQSRQPRPPSQPAGDMAPAAALLRQAERLARSLSEAARMHQTVQLASAIGSTAAGQSRIDPEAAPLKALHTVSQGMVDAADESAAQSDASQKHTGTGDGKCPHLTDPAIIQAGRAGIGQIAGQAIQLANGETTTLMSGQDSNFAIAGQARLHSGQAVGLLAGAIEPGPGNSGIKLIAAKDDIDLQAQSDEMKFQAKEEVKLVSVREHIDFAAAKRIVLSVKGGASLIIDGGITVQCPGTITVHANQKSFSGPVRENYPLPRFPNNPFENTPPRFNFKLTDIPGPDGSPLGDTPWRMVQAADANEALSQTESLLSGKSDAAGNLALTTEQEKQVAQAYLSGQRVWVLFEGQVKQLETTKEGESWTDQQKLEHALDSLGFADSFAMGSVWLGMPIPTPAAEDDRSLAEKTSDKAHDGGWQAPYEDNAAWRNSRTTDSNPLRLRTLDERMQPRMPWQDVHCRIEGPVVSDMVKNFVVRWNIGSKRKLKLPDGPRSYPKAGSARIQFLRSAPAEMRSKEYKAAKDAYAAPPSGTDDSIQQAMLRLIGNAAHFVYIESQFFVSAFGEERSTPPNRLSPVGFYIRDGASGISKTAVNLARSWDSETHNADRLPQNRVCKALIARIRQAILDAAKPAFHVYITLPVHPEGNLESHAIAAQPFAASHRAAGQGVQLAGHPETGQGQCRGL